jgi:hypothetical protein
VVGRASVRRVARTEAAIAEVAGGDRASCFGRAQVAGDGGGGEWGDQAVVGEAAEVGA